MTRYRVRCGVCGDGPDFTDPTDPKCAGCMLHADDCTCSPERPSIEDEWYEQDSGGSDASAEGAESTPVQAVISPSRPSSGCRHQWTHIGGYPDEPEELAYDKCSKCGKIKGLR